MTIRCKAITAVLGLIFCGAAILSLSPVTVETKETSLSDCLSQPVKCLKSFFHDNTVEKPLLEAVLEDRDLVSISLPMIPKDYLPLYASGLAEQIYNHMRQAQPQPESTRISTKFNNYVKKSIQHITSFSSSSYIACATHFKGSVVTTTTAGDENMKNLNIVTDEKSTMVSSYTACAIRLKDSVVKKTSAEVNIWAWMIAVGFLLYTFHAHHSQGLRGFREAHFGRVAADVVMTRVMIYWIWVVIPLLLISLVVLYLVTEHLNVIPRQRYRDAKKDQFCELLSKMKGDSWDEWHGLIAVYYERKFGNPPTEEVLRTYIWDVRAKEWEKRMWRDLHANPPGASADPAEVVERLRENFHKKVVMGILNSLETRIVPYDQ